MTTLQTPTNWPNPDRPGEPLFAERDGLHVVLGPFDETPVLILWRAQDRTYLKDGVVFAPNELLGGAIMYHGPVLAPEQIAEMLAAERERICLMIERSLDASCGLLPPAGRTLIKAAAEDVTEAIRNLGDAP